MKKIDKLAVVPYSGEMDGTTILHLNGDDIELIVRLLHQELDAVHGIIERNQGKPLSDWLDRADHCEDLIIQLLR
tara:strand:- start:753 stop:977 length:225 start_codon:yes stop_codon:yes gene_type:complete